MQTLMIFTICLLLIGQVVLSQTFPVCTEDINCPWSEERTFRMDVSEPHCDVTVKYKVRICNGVSEYAITEITANEGCEGWDQIVFYQYSYSGLIDYVTQGLLQFQATDADNIPMCPSSDPNYANVYTAGCGAWVYCEFTLPPNPTPSCPDWQGPLPHFGMSPPKVRHYKWQSCGTACCKRVYSICKRLIDMGYFYQIKLLTKSRITECTGQVNYPNTTCEDGC